MDLNLKKEIKTDVTFKWHNNNTNTNEQTSYIKNAELIDKKGQPIKRYAPTTKPSKLKKDIEHMLL